MGAPINEGGPDAAACAAMAEEGRRAHARAMAAVEPERAEAPEGATLSRSDYEKWRRHDYAGAVGSDHRWAAFWREHFPWWDGKYWLMSGSSGGVSLGPINVRN